ncbi:MAG: response regulator, partial [Methylobacteriaceae bacterium]
VFMTANAKRIPPDFAGALGVIAKPYSERAVAGALDYVAQRRAGHPPSAETLDGFHLAPAAGGGDWTGGAP